VKVEGRRRDRRKDQTMTLGMIKMKISRPDGKGFTCYFPTLEDAKNFQVMMQTIVANVKREATLDVAR